MKKKITDKSCSTISDLSLINNIPNIISYLSMEIAPLFLTAAYIGPSRASGKRFDRIQELSVSRLDSSGDNTAMYLYSLDQRERDSFNQLLARACGHTIQVEESGPGHVSVKIGRQGQVFFENIADVGFGFSQLLPVIAQLHAIKERIMNADLLGVDVSIFAVEQPELHLHPAMQSRLADLFVSAISRDSGESPLIIVVETHSETLISQLGALVAEGTVSVDDIAIYFVNKDEISSESSIQERRFNQDGLIPDWPIGFFSA